MVKNIILGFNSIVDLDTKKVYDFNFLKELNQFCKDNNYSLFLVSGLKKELTKDLVQTLNLEDIFTSQNIFSVDDDSNYYDSLSNLDQMHRLQKYKNNLFYYDHYFKVYFLNNNLKVKDQDNIFIGHDVFTDAYYSYNYAKTPFLLIKENLKYNSKDIDPNRFPKDYFIDPKLSSLIEHLSNTKEYDFSKFNSFIKNNLFQNLIGQVDLLSNKKISKFIIDNVKNKKKYKDIKK